MWKPLLIFLISSSVVSCGISCRNSIHGWGLHAGQAMSTSHENMALPSDSLEIDTTFDPNNIQEPTWYNDTMFLRRTVRTKYGFTSKNFVYLDTNRNSKYYDWLVDFTFDAYDTEILENYDLNGVTSINDLESNSIADLPKRWLPLFSLNGDYVISKPSDFGNARRRILSKDHFIYWYMDGPMPVEIIATKASKENPVTLILKDPDGYPYSLIIHCIDAVRHIYVFEYPSFPEKNQYQLFIPAEYARDFDIVVNTGNEKAMEYPFDVVDIKSLLEPQD